MSPDRVRTFKRLETDEELKARLYEALGYSTYQNGEALDDFAWRHARLQRRLVEDMR